MAPVLAEYDHLTRSLSKMGYERETQSGWKRKGEIFQFDIFRGTGPPMQACVPAQVTTPSPREACWGPSNPAQPGNPTRDRYCSFMTGGFNSTLYCLGDRILIGAEPKL